MIFLRHPLPKVEAGICYGRLDLDIAEEGHGQIERALELTPRAARVLASPALRCRRLALALAERDGAEIVYDARLWEMHMGEWEGLAWAAIPREQSEPWAKDPFNLPTPGGECFREVQERVLAALEQFQGKREPVFRPQLRKNDDLERFRNSGRGGKAPTQDDGVTAVVCHAGPIRAVQMAWHGLSFREAFASSPPYSEPIELKPLSAVKAAAPSAR